MKIDDERDGLLNESHASSRAAKICSKITLLLIASIIPFGSHFMKHALAPIKPYFVTDHDELSNATTAKFTHTEFGAFLGATSWPNLMLPMVSGMLVDEKGALFAGVFFTTLALIGHIIFCVFLSPSLLSFPMALMGRVIYGLGEVGTGIVQGAVIGTWFEGDMAFAIGITESIHYFANFCGKALPAKLVEIQGSPLGALWMGCFFLFISVVVALLYSLFAATIERPFVFALERYHSGGSPPPSQRKEQAKRLRAGSSSGVSWYGAVMIPEDKTDDSPGIHYYIQVHIERIKTLPLSFWLLGILHLLYSNLHGLFGGFSADFLYTKIGKLTPAQSGFIASLDSLFPIFIAPFIGYIVDRFGGRLVICMIASLTTTMGFAIFWYADPLTPHLAIDAMLLLAVSSSTTPTLIKSAVPLVCSIETLGTAFGIYSMFESLGGASMHIVFGIIVDNSGSYDDDILTLLVFGLASLFIAAMFWRKYGTLV